MVHEPVPARFSKGVGRLDITSEHEDGQLGEVHRLTRALELDLSDVRASACGAMWRVCGWRVSIPPPLTHRPRCLGGSPVPSNERTPIAIAVMGAAFAGYLAMSSPTLIPAITLAVAAFVALLAFLKL